MIRSELSKLANDTHGSNGSLPEPHFDDEATLLSARRVVPFHKLAESTNSKRNLFFGATLTAALVMGVIGGVIYARLGGSPAPKAEMTDAVAPTAEPAAQDELVSSSAQEDELSSTPDNPNSPATDQLATDQVEQKISDKPRFSSNVRKKVALSPAPAPLPARRTPTEPDDLDYYENEREIRRAERRAARRARREASRETQRSDDLFRIREIFEGSPRP